MFQPDLLLFFEKTVYLFEVKNYQGEFKIESDFLHSYATKKQYRNPMHQLKRSELMLRSLLNSIGCHTQIIPLLVFTHPTFTLFKAEKEYPIILPTQLQPFIGRLNKITGTITDKHKNIVRKLRSLHVEESPYTRYSRLYL